MTLKTDLAQFIGTEKYHPMYPNIMLTDGAKYLAEEAGCYWVYDIIMSVAHTLTQSNFISFNLSKTGDASAAFVIDDGNHNTLYEQTIDFTDFPMDTFQWFGQRSPEGRWVLMLPSEY